MEWQGKGSSFKLFINVMEGQKPLKALPVAPFEALQMGHVCAVQYTENFPGMSVEALFASLKQMTRHGV